MESCIPKIPTRYVNTPLLDSHHDDGIVQTQEVFADTSQLPLTKKKMKKLEAQDSNESRK